MNPVSHFFFWNLCDESLWPNVAAEFVDNGVERIVLFHHWMARLETEPEFIGKLRQLLGSSGLRFDGAHALWGAGWDLNEQNPELRSEMLLRQKRQIEFTGELGAGVIVIHVGDSAYHHGNPPPEQLRLLTVDALEKLLPVAEKAGVVIAIENIIAPTDTVEELLAIFGKIDSPNLGCCFDSGHENVMSTAPDKSGKDLVSYIRDTLWHGEPRFQTRILEQLLPHIVCCHLHDNSGFGDEHKLPGNGTVDWGRVIPLLKQAPRLMSVQNEANCVNDCSSIANLVRTYDRLWQE